MITIIVLFQFCQHFITHYLHFFRQQIQIIAHLLLYFFFRNAADGSIRFIHTDVLDIIQFTEDAQLGKLCDTGEEHKTQIRITSFQRTIEIAHHIPKDRQILFLMNNVKKRSVVFINEDNDLPTGLLANTADQSGETIIQSHFLTHFAIHLFIPIQLNTQHLLQTFLIHMLRHAHVKVKHRIPSPFRLQLINGKSLKQFLTTFKIRMQCAGEQTLAKAARTTQKHILRVEMRHSINVFRLIYIQIVLSADFRESLYSYRIKLPLLFHIFLFTSKLSSIPFT